MRKVLSVLALLALIAGCASMPGFTIVPRIDFPVAEYDALQGREGTGVVTGQVFLRTRGGEVRYGAGSEVVLNPVTSYSRQWYEQAYLGGQRLSDPDMRAADALIKTQADGSGNFRFDNVPPGDYYLTSSVFWEAPGASYLSSQGGYISSPVTVDNGKEVKQILTR